ncbi:hypothetical protein GCM10012280_59500 [Wenjunlia tyrosinilytica]|uniref:Uncharacterized protein n=1 Tax=Wenjunlia tyrosinilytica TaxID=1544741 RepID=A0A917ZWX4_9ACTN|nr:hypothetical protein GCM10012280_59500 [Wenjunlia tyrosinilytica]
MEKGTRWQWWQKGRHPEKEDQYGLTSLDYKYLEHDGRVYRVDACVIKNGTFAKIKHPERPIFSIQEWREKRAWVKRYKARNRKRGLGPVGNSE